MHNIFFFQVFGIPRDCCKLKTKMISRNALNPIWEENFDIEIHLPELAFIKFTVLDVGSNFVTAQRIVPVTKLRPGYRHLRLHNEHDQPLPLSQLFLCSQFLDGDLVEEESAKGSAIKGGHINVNPVSGGETVSKKRMSFLVVHDISEHAPYAILKVPENATTRDVIRQAVSKAGANGNEHEFVLLEEVLAPSANGEDFLTTPPTQQRMVGMDECPLYIRNKWKSDSKFVLKRVGADPSWRARLGNLMIAENNQGSLPGRRHSTHFEVPEEDISEQVPPSETPGHKKDVDNFLVCVFNVSSKVSYSILQAPKTATSQDIIIMALNKSRRGEEDADKPEKFVLVEETDPPASSSVHSGPQLNSKKGSKGKKKRVLDDQENVYLVQLAWKGAGRLILEEKEKLLREGQLYLDVPHNAHLTICETHSDPLGGHHHQGGLHLSGKVSPRIRRSSKIIASGMRRFSRSLYGGDHSTTNAPQSSQTNLSIPHAYTPQHRPKQRRVTTAAMSLSPSSISVYNNGEPTNQEQLLPQRRARPRRVSTSVEATADRSEILSEGEFIDDTLKDSRHHRTGSVGPAAGRKMSKVNLRKLKIW